MHFCSLPPCCPGAAPAHAPTSSCASTDGAVSRSRRPTPPCGEILAEWARVGQTRIVNAERVHRRAADARADRRHRGAGARHHPALGQRLHGGAPRRRPSPNASRFDRILVLPTQLARRAATPPPPPPAFAQPPQFAARSAAVPSGQSDAARRSMPGRSRRPRRDADVQDDPAPHVVRRTRGPPLTASARAAMPPARQQPPNPSGHRRVGRCRSASRVPGMVVPPPQPQPAQPGRSDASRK